MFRFVSHYTIQLCKITYSKHSKYANINNNIAIFSSDKLHVGHFRPLYIINYSFSETDHIKKKPQKGKGYVRLADKKNINNTHTHTHLHILVELPRVNTPRRPWKIVSMTHFQVFPPKCAISRSNRPGPYAFFSGFRTGWLNTSFNS